MYSQINGSIAVRIILFILLFGAKNTQSQNCLFFEGFESGSLNPAFWTATPSVNGSVIPIEEKAKSGAYSLRMSKTVTSGGQQTQTLDLKYNLAAFNDKDLELSFWIFDLGDETHPQDGLFFSRDGVNFELVLPFQGSDWCNDQYGRFPPIDVDELARQKFGQNWASPNFVIRWQQYDNGNFQGSDPDGFHLDDICLIEAPKVYFPVRPGIANQFCDDFETCTLSQYWAWRYADKTNTLAQIPTRPSNLVEVQTGVGYNNSNCALYMGKRCTDGSATNVLDAHLDLENQTQVALTFWMRDRGDEFHKDDALFFSNDGGKTFVKLFEFRFPDYCNNIWGQFPPIDLDEWVAKAGLTFTKNCILRFQQHDNGTDSGSDPDGFYLDDVCVFVPEQTFVKVRENLPFCEDFEMGTLRSMWAWRWAEQTTVLGSNITRLSNFVHVTKGTGVHNSAFAVDFGKRCNDDLNAVVSNALDLYLDLENQQGVELSFWIRDNGDETQIDDGIYFSNDGGKTFKKVFDFRPGEWCNYQWGLFPPLLINQLAEKVGLTLTKDFVIRFQQHDDSQESGIDPDGLRLDDICVSVAPTVYGSVPFYDDFELGEYNERWKWTFAEKTSQGNSILDQTRPSNWVELQPGAGNNSQFGVWMGKRCDDAPTAFATNAFNLNVNLLGKQGVKLQVDLKKNGDEEQTWDGIYFSNDGGENFKKISTLHVSGSNWQKFPTQPLDLDALAAAAPAMPYSDKCIIRFQQYDNGDNGGTDPDGLFLDNVNLTVGSVSTNDNLRETAAFATIFPNPTSEELQIFVQNLDKKSSLQWEIFHSDGSRLLFGESQSEYFTVDLSQQNSGIYYLKIRSETGVQMMKISKI